MHPKAKEPEEDGAIMVKRQGHFPKPTGSYSGGILGDESQPFSTSENIKAANSNLSVTCK